MPAKTWIEKFELARPAEVKPVPNDMVGMKKGEAMLLPTPRMIDDFVRTIPKGKTIDTADMRKTLAKCQNADVTCPIVTGIHLRTVSEVAYERHQQGVPLEDITPFWRVVSQKTPLAKKLSCGPDFVADLRKKEGLAP